MGDKVEPRRKWIESNVAFNLVEEGDTLLDEAAQGEELDSQSKEFVAPIIESWQDKKE